MRCHGGCEARAQLGDCLLTFLTPPAPLLRGLTLLAHGPHSTHFEDRVGCAAERDPRLAPARNGDGEPVEERHGPVVARLRPYSVMQPYQAGGSLAAVASGSAAAAILGRRLPVRRVLPWGEQLQLY